MGQGKRRNAPITASSVVSFARISLTCRTCGQKRDVDPIRAVTGVANQQGTMLYCGRRCNKLAPAVADLGRGPCQACGADQRAVALRSGITLCLACAWEAFRACLSKPRFADEEAAVAAIPGARAEDLPFLHAYPCPLCGGAHQTKKRTQLRDQQRAAVAGVQAAYLRLGLDTETDRTAEPGHNLT